MLVYTHDEKILSDSTQYFYNTVSISEVIIVVLELDEIFQWLPELEQSPLNNEEF